MEFKFTYKAYSDFLEQCKKTSQFHLMRDALSINNGFLLRHDIDFDLKLAKKLLIVELEADILSTNFILVSNPAYNIFTKENRQIIGWIINNGFEVGLHFDPTVYSYKSFEEINDLYLAEKKLLESLTNKEITSVSLHCPSIHGEFLEFKNVINAYDSRIFNDANYLSDSRKGFRNKNPYEIIKRANKNLFQMLFHPVHFSDNELSYKQIFKKLAIDRVNELDGLIRPYNSKFVEEMIDKTIIEILTEVR